MLTFSSKTGELKRDGVLIGRGYAGAGAGKLNPDMETVPDVGPLPRGKYSVQVITIHGIPADYERKKAPVFRLTPHADTNTFGRAGFLIHGDSVSAPGTASQGCIVVGRDIREDVLKKRDAELEVI